MSNSALCPLPATLEIIDFKKDDLLQAPTVSVTEILEPEDENIVQESNDTSLAALGIDLNASHIQSSPYANVENHLNLEELDLPNRLFALALTQWHATRPDYATAPYLDSFNWPEVFALLRRLCVESGIEWQRQEFYLVIFRSKLRTTADRARLGELDQKSHEEACASGGLLTYWFGSPDAECRNLASCIWRNREDAAAGGKGPWHRKARASAREMYESISFHTHRFVVEDGAHSWHLEDHHD